jgi:hypothetical protein
MPRESLPSGLEDLPPLPPMMHGGAVNYADSHQRLSAQSDCRAAPLRIL